MTRRNYAVRDHVVSTPQVNGWGLLLVLCSVVGNVPSGGDLLALELVKRWPRAAGPVTLLTSVSGKQYADAIGLRDAKVKLLQRHLRLDSSVALSYLLRAIEAPAAALRPSDRTRPRPEFVFSASPFLPDLVAGLSARAAGMQWIQSWQLLTPPPWVGYENAHERKPEGSLLSRVGRAFPRTGPALSYMSQGLALATARRWCHTLLVPTKLMALEAAKRGFAESQIHVTELGVDLAHIRRVTTGSSSSMYEYDALFIGRFHAQKGLTDLISIWKTVLAMRPGARIAVIGDGHSQEAVRFKSELKLMPEGSVDYLGVLTGDEKYRAIGRARVLLFPSHYESWGHVVIEAMAAGLPVVGYDLPSSRQTFGDAIATVPLADTERFASTIVSLLDSNDYYEEYRTRGLRVAEKYNWDTIADAFIERIVGADKRI